MNRIEKLIQELCPNGIPFVPLAEIATIKNGRDYKHLEEGPVPVYGSGGILAHVNEPAYVGETVLLPRKGSLSSVFYVDGPVWTVDTCYYTVIDESAILPKFFYYYMVMSRLERLNTAGGVPSLTQRVLNKLLVPVPPLEVQREIVKILDLFTELEAELEARRKQYEHFRDQLLTFPENGGATWVELGDIAEFTTGSMNTNEAEENGLYPFFVRSQVPRKSNTWQFDEEAVITAGDGVGVGKVFHYINDKFALHQRAYRIKSISERVSTKFLFYYMRVHFASYLEKTSVHASVTSLRMRMFERFPVQLPSPDAQARIVDVLDKFDALVNDLSFGLPAEIEARRKQYEYYRDKLLTFKELQPEAA